MKKGLIIIVLTLSFVGVTRTYAQISLNTLSANVGTIRTLFPNYSPYEDYQYSFYPELQVGGDFLTPSIQWIVCWGYWMDGVKKAFPVADMVTYSYSSHLLGARFNIFPGKLLPHWPLPVGVFTGLAHHFISGKYVGGFGLDGRPGRDFTRSGNTFEAGINAELEALGPIAVRGEIHQLFPLGNEWLDRMQKNRRAYTVGLAVHF